MYPREFTGMDGELQFPMDTLRIAAAHARYLYKRFIAPSAPQLVCAHAHEWLVCVDECLNVRVRLVCITCRFPVRTCCGSGSRHASLRYFASFARPPCSPFALFYMLHFCSCQAPPDLFFDLRSFLLSELSSPLFFNFCTGRSFTALRARAPHLLAAWRDRTAAMRVGAKRVVTQVCTPYFVWRAIVVTSLTPYVLPHLPS